MPGRPRKAEPEVALKAAMHAFWAKGYEATSMSDLTQATGLHKASLYQTFGDKRGLFISALRLHLDNMAAIQRHYIGRETNPYKALKKAMSKSLAHCGENRGCLAVNSLIEIAPYDDEVDRLLKQYQTRLSNSLARLIDEGKRTRRIPASINSREAVRMIVVFTQGLLTNMAGGMSVKRARELLHDYLELLLRPRKPRS